MAFAPCHALRPRIAQRRTRACTIALPRRHIVRAVLGRVLVIGAGAGIGLEVARALHASSATSIVGSVRAGEETTELRKLADTVVELDASDDESVQKTLSDSTVDCVICCEAANSRKLTSAAERAGAHRYVLVSALGAGDSERDVPIQAYFTMRDTLVEFSLAEAAVRASKLDWTIARPGPEVEGPATGKAIFSEDHRCYGTICAADIADAVVRAADSPNTVHKTLSVVDRDRVLFTAPYVRPLEFWESLPFDEFEL